MVEHQEEDSTVSGRVERLVERLIEQLSDSMALVRSSAAKQLSEVAAEEDITAAIPSLTRVLEDQDISVRRRSADALGAAAFYKQDITSAIPTLIRLLEDKEDNMVMKNAARALSDAAEKGQDISLAVSALTKLAKTSFGEKEDDFTRLAKDYASKAVDFAAKRTRSAIPGMTGPIEKSEHAEGIAEARERVGRGEYSGVGWKLLVSLLDDGDAHVRRNAVGAIRMRPFDGWEPGVVPRLIGLLADPYAEVREGALAALASIYPEPEGARYFAGEIRRAAPTAIELLGDASLRVRGESARLLGWISNDFPNDIPEAIPKLIELLDAEDEEGREQAAWALEPMARHFPEEVRKAAPRLITAVNRYHRTGWHVGQLLAVVAEIFPDGVQGAIPKLVELLGNDDPGTKIRAASVLAAMAEKFPLSEPTPDGLKTAVQRLTTLLDSDDEEARQHAAGALAGIARMLPHEVEASAPKLVMLLDAKDWFTRCSAASGLGRMAENLAEDVVREAVPRLTRLLSDSHGYVRSYAAAALGRSAVRIPGCVRETIRKLMEHLGDDDAQESAVQGLAEIAKAFPRDVREELLNPVWPLDAGGGGVRTAAMDYLQREAGRFPEDVRAAIPRSPSNLPDLGARR